MKKTTTIKHDRLNSQPLSNNIAVAPKNAEQQKQDKPKERSTKGTHSYTNNKGLRHSVSYESVGDSESKQSVQGKQTSSK